MQAVAIVLVLVSTAAGVALLGRTAAGLVGTVRLGQPDRTRTDRPAERLRTLPEWEHDAIHDLLNTLKDERGLNPKNAFQPIRAAVTGVLVSPPLFESMELLGRDRSIERILAGAELARAGGPQEAQTEG